MSKSAKLVSAAPVAVTGIGRAATLNAARDLRGAGSTPYNTVTATWSAVAVS